MISVIIPILNEVATITHNLGKLLSQEGTFEVIVVDGGSSDGTLQAVDHFPGVKLIRSARGRGRQMNRGADSAKGNIYLFLHADTHLPSGGLRAVEEVMAKKSVAGGSFFLDFDFHSLFLDIYPRLSHINHIYFTYGDQGLFVSADIFRAIGGFKDIPLMEDVEIQKRLLKLGRFVKIRQPVITSARRFLDNGTIRQLAVDIGLASLYHVGISPFFLRRFYKYL